jgi:hypothetical protein
LSLQAELKKIEYVDEALLETVTPQKPRPLAETPLNMVSNLAELNDMAAKLQAAQEFAVGSHQSLYYLSTASLVFFFIVLYNTTIMKILMSPIHSTKHKKIEHMQS